MVYPIKSRSLVTVPSDNILKQRLLFTFPLTDISCAFWQLTQLSWVEGLEFSKFDFCESVPTRADSVERIFGRGYCLVLTVDLFRSLFESL